MRHNKFLKLREDIDGYIVVGLSKNGKQKNYKVHRLVAIAFISNPNNYVEINHIDENKHNNNVDNLEWCTRKYNCNYGERHVIAKEKRENSISVNFPIKTATYNRIKEKVALDHTTIKNYLTSLIASDIKQDHRIDKYFNS